MVRASARPNALEGDRDVINRLDITRLRGLEDVRLNGLPGVSIIEGPGGSGKTTALEAAAPAASGGNGAAALYDRDLNHSAVDARWRPEDIWEGLFPGRDFERVVETAVADDEREHRLQLRCLHPYWNRGDVRVFEAGGAPQHEHELRYTKSTTGADAKVVTEVDGDMHWVHGKYRSSSLDAPVALPTTVTTRRDGRRRGPSAPGQRAADRPTSARAAPAGPFLLDHGGGPLGQPGQGHVPVGVAQEPGNRRRAAHVAPGRNGALSPLVAALTVVPLLSFCRTRCRGAATPAP